MLLKLSGECNLFSLEIEKKIMEIKILALSISGLLQCGFKAEIDTINNDKKKEVTFKMSVKI